MKQKIGVVGLWHLGSVNSACFAKKGFEVVGIDFNEEIIKALQQGKAPLFEPGLDQLIQEQINQKNLSYTTQINQIKGCDGVLIAFDSPVNDNDEVDVTPVVESALLLAPYLDEMTPLIITSQVPLGTCDKIEGHVRSKNPHWKSNVVYTPENLQLGKAIERCLAPDMVILGSNGKSTLETVQKIYQNFETQIVPMELKSAEMVKHALNGFLATSIAYINEIGMLCDKLGANAKKVGQALKMDKRIGPRAFLTPGLGYSGGTLARDVTLLCQTAHDLGRPAKLLESIPWVNNQTFEQVLNKVEEKLGQLEGKTIGILGLTYKPGTSTMRRSPAIKLIEKFVQKKSHCLGLDPMADPKELTEYKGLFERVNNASDLAKADALVLVTEWPQFKEIDFKKLASSMKHPYIMDSKNFLNDHDLEQAGFFYQGLGLGK